MENMKKVPTNNNEVKDLGIPLIGLLNVYKLERKVIYEKHKLSKKANKNTHS